MVCNYIIFTFIYLHFTYIIFTYWQYLVLDNFSTSTFICDYFLSESGIVSETALEDLVFYL